MGTSIKRAKKGSGSSQNQLNLRAHNLGVLLGRKTPKSLRFGKKGLPPVFNTKQKLRLLGRFFAKRKVDPKKPVSSQFNTFYRNELPGFDELVSTSTTREFFNGFFSQKGYSSLTPDLQKQVDTVADWMSTVRIPTQFSGYAKSHTDVMQHPTSGGGKGIFGSYKGNSASLHSQLDTQRKELVIQSAEAAAKLSNFTVESVVEAMLKTAIEFTLNYFTAPVTASNVFKYSQFKNWTGVGFPQVAKDQVAAREEMKQRYVELGGTLRTLHTIKGETVAQSLERPWQLKLTNLNPTSYSADPPSPRRG
ncbi:MAG: hypothetical protein ACYCS1_09985 [Gammaproteobacteria bacterium]